LTLKTAALAARVAGEPGGSVEAIPRVCKIGDEWSLNR